MDRNLFISIILSLVTVWTFQYFFMSNSGDSAKHGGSVAIEHAEKRNTSSQGGEIQIENDLIRPLQTDFHSPVLTQDKQTITVETDMIQVTIDEQSAAIAALSFKTLFGKNGKPMSTLDIEQSGGTRMHGALAVDAAVVANYSLLEQREIDGEQHVSFRAAIAGWDLTKTFVIKPNSYSIGMILSFDKKNHGEAIRPSIIFAAPYMTELGVDDYTQLFLFNERKQRLEIKELSIDNNTAWHWQTSRTIIGLTDRYFINALMHDDNRFVLRAYFTPGDTQSVRAIIEGRQVSESCVVDLSFYCGPKDYAQLVATDKAMVDLLNYGWLSSWCAILLRLLEWLVSMLSNFGLAIMALAFILRLPLVPIAVYGRIKADAYQKHVAIVNKIRTKYKHDQQAAQDEVVRYHKEHNLSPTATIMGCLPSLIQLPIMFCLYKILSTHLALYQSPFFGWIVDLSAKDPWYIFPVGMAITMLWSQLLSATDEKQKAFMIFMSLMMGAVAASWPAGLVLYWLVNNVITLTEDYLRKFFQRRMRA